MSRLLFAVAGVVALMALYVAPALATPSQDHAGHDQPAADSTETPAAPLPVDFVLGDLDAPVEIIEYGSLSCPACADFHARVFAPLKVTLIKNGKVKYIFRHIIRDQADLMASMLARCAGEDKYYDMIDFFFKRQAFWLNEQFPETLPDLARRLGLEPAVVDACIVDSELQDQLLAGMQHAGEKWGVTGTPTFIINGEKQKPEIARRTQFFNKMREILDPAPAN